MQDIPAILGADGSFARLIDGYAPRPQQQEMAQAVADTLASNGVLIAEAGTGTGKTFAYLVPALLSGQKVIISTGTKNLQDQLFHKDLPLVRKALNVPVQVALLKGRSNYLCSYRLELAISEGRFQSRSQVAELHKVREWAFVTKSGDVGELSVLPEDSPLWPQVTSNADNCLGSDCERFDECFLMQARRQAQEADVLVVNHHLLLSDMALRQEGFGELLPGANAFILDEAHQLPEIASNFFGTSVTGNQMLELARDTIAEELREAGDAPQIRLVADRLDKAVRDLRLAFGKEARRGSWNEVSSLNEITESIAEVADTLGELKTHLEPLAQRGKGLEACLRRCTDLEAKFEQVTATPPEGFIHWYEIHTRAFSINLTPLEVATPFRRQMEESSCAWIFTSATLAVGHSFEHFAHRMGIESAREERWNSPFDFPRQAVLYVPPDMPDPNDPHYTGAVIDASLPVLQASRGRAFILFTSHRALQEAASILQGMIDYPLLIQGEAPRTVLLDRFRELGNAVLLGTGSFWEGVDVRGEALSCVIIDKLPFASPGDPILQARIDTLRKRGGNPFMEYQLPQAVITLKQGVGRLIRDVNDRGVLMLCDPRLGNKAYGKLFLESLSPMTRTRKLEVVQRFFALYEKAV